MSPLPPQDTTEQVEKTVGLAIGLLTFAYGAIRYALRPLADEWVYRSWLRRSPDYEKHMRAEMFKDDIANRKRMEETLAGAVNVARDNATGIQTLRDEMRIIGRVVEGMPLLQAGLDAVSDDVKELTKATMKSLEVSAKHGEGIATALALVSGLPGRRMSRRRLTDADEMLDRDDGLEDGEPIER